MPRTERVDQINEHLRSIRHQLKATNLVVHQPIIHPLTHLCIQAPSIFGIRFTKFNLRKRK